MINYKKLTAALICGTIIAFPLGGCQKTGQITQNDSSVQNDIQNVLSDTSGLVLELDDEDTVTDYDSASAVFITLGQNNTTAVDGVTADGLGVKITKSGTYVFTGNLDDGSICVDTEDKETVRIILNGVNVKSNTTAPFIVENAKKVIVTLSDNTTNTFTDSTRTTTESEDYSSAVYSKEDLVFNGNGTLIINAGYRNGIKSSDDLKIVSGTYQITAAEDGVIGKDLLGIADGSFTIKAGADGMKSTYDKDTTKGNIIIAGGSLNINAANDGIQAENILDIQGGKFEIMTGNGSSAAEMKTGDDFGMGQIGNMFNTTTENTSSDTDSVSMKGLKAANGIYVYGGTITIDSQDDSIHSNNLVAIGNGDISLKSGDDGIHADSQLTIDGGTIVVEYSYEGLEAAVITINNADIAISAEDDGINASDGSSTETAGGFGMGVQNQNSDIALVINGGNLYVEADGDGIDSNGSITINGGNTIVCGPTSSGDTAVDFESQCILNGGTLLAFGSNAMVEVPTTAENGCCIVAGFTSQQADTEFAVIDSSQNKIISYTPEKTYAAAICYSADLKSGETYTVTAGSVSQSVTMESSVVTVGNISTMGGGLNGGKFGDMQYGQKGADNAEVPDMINGADGEMPSMPEGFNGEMPGMFEGTDGEMPSMPEGFEGEIPDMQNGEPGQMPNMQGDMNGRRDGGRMGGMQSEQKANGI